MLAQTPFHSRLLQAQAQSRQIAETAFLEYHAFSFSALSFLLRQLCSPLMSCSITQSIVTPLKRLPGHQPSSDQVLEALNAHLPPGYAIGDDATAELAVELAQAQARVAELEKDAARLDYL